MSVTLKVKFCWWVKPYIKAWALIAMLTGMMPDIDKMAARIVKGAHFTTYS